MIFKAIKIFIPFLILQSNLVRAQDDGLWRLRSAIVNFLSSKFKDRKVDYIIDFKGRVDKRLLQSGGEIQVVKKGGLDYRGYQTFKVKVSYGDSVFEAFVQAFVRTFEDVLVAKADLKRGEIIEPGEKFFKMLSFEKVETTFLRDDFVYDAGSILGKRLKRAVRRGEIIHEGYFEDLPAVRAGEAVKVIAKAGNVRIEISGVAKEDGQLNESIRVLNPSSGRLFFGKVVGHGVVEVEIKN